MSIKTKPKRVERSGIPRDQVFSTLSNRRRRWVLHLLKQRDSQSVDFRTVVNAVSAWEYETDPEELTWKQRKRIYTSLRQSHLPKLDDVGVVDYDKQRGTVELTDAAEQMEMYLEYVPEHDIPWSYCYLALSGVATAITLLAWGSVGPFAGLSGVTLVTILVALFWMTAVAHTVSTRRNRLGVVDLR